MSNGVRPAIPCASTVHGVLPRPAATSVPSPTPKRQTPRKRIPSVAAGARHVEPSALHGIVGTRGDGRSAATTRRALLPRLLSRSGSSTASFEQKRRSSAEGWRFGEGLRQRGGPLARQLYSSSRGWPAAAS